MKTLVHKLLRRSGLGQFLDFATEEDLCRCYRAILRREPDEAGWQSWTAAIRSGRVGLRKLWDGFHQSDEARNLLSVPATQPGPASPGLYRCAQLDGFRIYAAEKDYLVGAAVLAGCYEPHVTDLLRGLLRRGAVFVDIGANVGYFSLMAASLVGPRGQVIAFEPRPDNVALLTLSVKDNGFTNVIVHPHAVAEREQVFKVYPSQDTSLSHVVEADRKVDHTGQVYSVRAVALDEFLADLPRLDFMKIDIDGNELRAFQGMRGLLRRHRPVIAFEYSPPLIESVGQGNAEDLLKEIQAHDYDLFIVGRTLGGPQARETIMKEYAGSGLTHLDLVAYPKPS
jgi:FkbM family methyltransferase